MTQPRTARVWKGQALHTATGAASAKHSHCQLRNCRAKHHRQHQDRHREQRGDEEAFAFLPNGGLSTIRVGVLFPRLLAGGGGTGRAAWYPACSTAATSSSAGTLSG